MTGQRPMVVVGDDDLLDEVLRIAAATACAVERVPDVHAARARWTRAPLTVVDEATLESLSGDVQVAGGELVVVSAGHPGDESWKRFYEFGVGHVVALPDDEATLAGMFADLVDGPRRSGGRVLATVGARGGAGASVLAAAAAAEAARAGGRVLLVDCDGRSAGLDLVLGAEHDDGIRWPDVRVRSGRLSMAALADALPTVRCGGGRMALLSCGRDGAGPTVAGVGAVLDAATRAGYTVVCDLPRELGPVGEHVVARADLVAVVVPAEVRASASAKVLAGRLAGARRVSLVVRGPAPDGLPPGVISEAVGLDVLTVMRAEPKLARRLDRAEFAPRSGGPLATGARAVLESLLHDDAPARPARLRAVRTESGNDEPPALAAAA